MITANTHDPAPPGALDARRSGVERLLEVLKGGEVLEDGSLEGPVVEHAAGALALGRRAREVLPEERVVDVA